MILRVFYIGILLALTGCGSGGERFVPVRGVVTVDGKPLTLGTIGFHPDPAKGNERGQASLGEIRPDGTFEVNTAGKPGMPLGWYKVLVWATNDPNVGNPWGPDGKRRPIAWLTDSKYTAQGTTDLAVEVVEDPAPGRYDFNLAR